jgi:putative ABC transport system permease protein
MNIKSTIKTALLGLKTNKSRSALTILGIVIGVTAIIVLMALGQGAQNLILSQIQSMGSNLIVVHPGREPSGPSDFAQALTESLKAKDLDELRKKTNVPDASDIIPISFGSVTASYGSETYRFSLMGSTPELSTMMNMYPSEGQLFTDEDVASHADVIVIGSKIKDKLFGNESAIGQKIKVKDRSLRVVGSYSSKGQVSLFNMDESAIMPYTTAQDYIFSTKSFFEFIISAVSKDKIEAVRDEVNATLRASHNIDDPSKDDFHTTTQADLVSRISIITDVMTLFLVAVAAISLIVGGIGIMNIMLVSVTERTREIGLRKAVGATEKNILLQFLFEAVILTSAGGLTGVILGAGISYLAAIVLSRVAGLDWIFVFPFSAAAIGLLVSGAVGLVFGIYPARQASRKSPIEALRYE